MGGTYFHLFSEINPDVQRAKEESDNKDNITGDLYINDPLHIVDDEWPCMGEIGVMLTSQPEFEMGKGTEPAKNLYDKGKGEAGEMEDLYNPTFPSP